jgi:soluble cytochrome b562
MLKRVVIGACLVWLTGGIAYAADEAGETECTDQLAKVEELVHDKIEAGALAEDDTEKVNELLDEADALCAEGNFDDARATLDSVAEMIQKAPR